MWWIFVDVDIDKLYKIFEEEKNEDIRGNKISNLIAASDIGTSSPHGRACGKIWENRGDRDPQGSMFFDKFVTMDCKIDETGKLKEYVVSNDSFLAQFTRPESLNKYVYDKTLEWLNKCKEQQLIVPIDIDIATKSKAEVTYEVASKSLEKLNSIKKGLLQKLTEHKEKVEDEIKEIKLKISEVSKEILKHAKNIGTVEKLSNEITKLEEELTKSSNSIDVIDREKKKTGRDIDKKLKEYSVFIKRVQVMSGKIELNIRKIKKEENKGQLEVVTKEIPKKKPKFSFISAFKDFFSSIRAPSSGDEKIGRQIERIVKKGPQPQDVEEAQDVSNSLKGICDVYDVLKAASEKSSEEVMNFLDKNEGIIKKASEALETLDDKYLKKEEQVVFQPKI